MEYNKQFDGTLSYNGIIFIISLYTDWWYIPNTIVIIHIYIYGSVSIPCTPGGHQNSWDLWMFIPLKMVLIAIDPYIYISLFTMLRIWVTFRPHFLYGSYVPRAPRAPSPLQNAEGREAIVREEADEIRGARLVPLGRDLRLRRSIASSGPKNDGTGEWHGWLMDV